MLRLPLVLCLPFLSFGACAQQAKPPTTPPTQTVPAPQPAKPSLPEMSPIHGYTLAEDAATLVGQPGVPADLKLTKVQVKSTSQVFVDLEAKMEQLTKQSATDEAFDKVSKEAVDQVLTLLGPEEQERLKQLALQAMGWDSFRIDEVRQSMVLTPDQAKALDKALKEFDTQSDALSSELGDRMSKLKQPGPNATDDENKAFEKAQQDVLADLKPKADALTELKKKSYVDFLASLNGAQQDKWKALQGRPFGG